MSQIETVRAFEGDWTLVDPPENLGDPTKRYVTDSEGADDSLSLRSALAISQAGGNYFESVPGSRVVTFLSFLVGLPKPGETEPGPHRSALHRALGSIGFRIMRYEGNLMSLEKRHPLGMFATELEGPAVTFARMANLHGETIGSHEVYPQGPGYATVRWDTQPDGFTLGWCDPIDGRRSEVFVDSSKIRLEHPGLEPKVKLSADPGGM